MARPHRKLTEAERDERRRRDRERLAAATRALLSWDGWRAWLRARAAFHEYSLLVSSTVKDLVVGSGIEFADRGAHALKGAPDEWRLYAVD
jgi:hypothetical protein